MKRLIIMRHGEAESPARGSKDKDRELTEDGIREVSLKGIWLNDQGLSIDKMLISTATRTSQTGKLIQERCNVPDAATYYYDEMYNAALGSLLEIVENINDKYETIMMVAHNPGVSYLTEYYTNEYVGMIPSCIVSIDFGVDSWQEVSKGLGELKLCKNELIGE